MKTIFAIACFLALSCVEAKASLNNLRESDKMTCLEALEQATDAELWDVFLEGQAELFFDSELNWFAQGIWWEEAENILEIGSGNGAYLYRLSQQFQDRMYKGVEKLPQPVNDANQRYVRSNLVFEEGDAEVFNNQLVNSSDIVLFRLTLQHLKDPFLALVNAAHYLSSNGYVVIIDAYDKAKRSSHPTPTTIRETLELVAEIQKKAGKGNRKVTLELLQILENKQSPLSEFYEVAYSNLDTQGNVIDDCIRLQGEKIRKLGFNHSLLLLTLLHRTHDIPVDFSKAYDELQEYQNDPNAWSSPGAHFLVLKKRG